ncbi:aldehyde dehydrogenase family protein [Exilibacterium tricleocarpae]|uniref:Aldehyde dehydrogenase family protein n=1 Tax=Exilibacterium tricleocarpae TaxID=2591008 RepID=A0A545SYV1_9GAMM|nr:aldehyde dehydrogenase family protein [Exilibacterium tricleocarpae]TQV70141.1 aldehyde dehydrogenase family protein [Exilibacterium tricleocarpae]
MEFAVTVAGATAAGNVTVTSPYDGAEVGRVETLDSAGIETALSIASALFADKNQWLDAHQRIAILEKTAVLMAERAQHLAAIAVSEGGKPLIDTRVEVDRAIDGIKNCIECIRTESGREIPMRLNPASANRLAFTTREPIGVVVAVSAFNHPLNLIVHQIGPAIASGCPVIVKPAEDTPLSCFALLELLREAGLPDGWCQAVLTTDHGVAEQLVTDPRVAFFSFIGSAKIGWMLRSKLAPGTRCALEHGGAAPVIVAPDADLGSAVPLLAKGGLYHAGQVCVSVQRVFAHQAVARTLADQLAQQAKAAVVGDPAAADTTVGPLIRGAEVDRVEQWVAEAVAGGAEVLSGGKRIDAHSFAPTILLNPPATAKVSTQEIFGPVICVYAYEDIDTALQQANSLPVAFQASVFTSDIDTAMHASRHLAAAAVMVNDHTAFRVDWMPFAGLRQSGHGVGGIPYTYEDMQVEKMIVIRSPKL